MAKVTERKKSQADLRAAAARVKQTCGMIAVADMSGPLSSPAEKDYSAGNVLSKAVLVLVAVAVVALMTLGCAFSPEGLQSAGASMQQIGGAVADIAPGTPIGGVGGLVEAVGGLLIGAGALWAKGRFFGGNAKIAAAPGRVGL